MGYGMTIKVIIADDHSLVRQGLRRYLEMAGDIDVVGEAANGFEVLKLMENGEAVIADEIEGKRTGQFCTTGKKNSLPRDKHVFEDRE